MKLLYSVNRLHYCVFILLSTISLSSCKNEESKITPQTPVPVISSFAPATGRPGTEITLKGKNFSATLSKNAIKFNGIAASVKVATTDSLVVVVPSGTSTGKITAQVGTSEIATSNSDFVYFVDAWKNLELDFSLSYLGARYGQGNVSIDGVGYIMLYSTKSDAGAMWTYTPATNTWKEKASFPGNKRQNATYFAIGTKIYYGFGIYYASSTSVPYSDFWEYDTVTDTWTQKADFPWIPRTNATGFSIGTKGYIGTGYVGQSSMIGSDMISTTRRLNDFWEYDPATDTWSKKADFGGVERSHAVSFVINGKGYIGTGSTGSESLADFWEYDPSTNVWVKKADFGGGARTSAAGFALGTKGYIGTGSSSKGYFNDFWEYNPVTNTWTSKANVADLDDPGAALRDGGLHFSIAGKGYIAGGWNGKNSLIDLIEYMP